MENMKKLIGKFIFMSATAVIICILPIFTIKVKADDRIDPVIYRADGTPAVKDTDWKYNSDSSGNQIYLLSNNLIIHQTAIENDNTYYSIFDDCSAPGQHTFYFKNFNVDGETTDHSLFMSNGDHAVKLYFDQCNINIITNDPYFDEVISGYDIEILGDPSGTNNELSITTSIGSCIGIYRYEDLSTRLVLGNDDNFKIKLTSNNFSICDNTFISDLIINKGTDLLCYGTISGFSNIDIYGKMDVICSDNQCFLFIDTLKSFNVNQSSDLFLSTNCEDGVFCTYGLSKEFLNLDNVLVGASENFGSRDNCNRILKYDGDGCYKVVVDDECKVPKSIHFCGFYSVIINGVEAYYLRGEKIEKPSDPTDEKGGTFIGWYIEGTDTKWDFDSEVKGGFTLVPRFSYPDDPTPNPAPNNEIDKLNHELTNLINDASKKDGNVVIRLNDYLGTDCITRDNLKLLSEKSNVILVLDYTFFDIDTNKNIHVHAVINKANISPILNDKVDYYGPANLSGFVQYYNMLPVEIRNMNL